MAASRTEAQRERELRIPLQERVSQFEEKEKDLIG